jgi:hypothetical protein
VVINSFSGVIIPLRVAKKVDKFNEQLLVEDNEQDSEETNKGVWSSFSG